MKAKVRAHANIALIKYWGKKNEAYKIPYQSSISLTLDQFYTETEVMYDKQLEEDILFINGKKVEGARKKRVSSFLDWIRKTYQIPYHAYIYSFNHVPEAAGLASSASAFAALGVAALKAYGITVSNEEMSKVARFGSGSASRSIYAGFVAWQKGFDHESSFSYPLNIVWPEFRMIACLVNEKEKLFLSNQTMKETVLESPFYQEWVLEAEKDFELMLTYLKEKDIHKVGLLAQKNALKMHATILSIGKWYFEPKTIAILNKLYQLQSQGIPAYFTMDAGPNVKILTTETYVKQVLDALGDLTQTVVCKSGPGVEFI